MTESKAETAKCQGCLVSPRDSRLFICAINHNSCRDCLDSNEGKCPVTNCPDLETISKRNTKGEEYIASHDVIMHCKYRAQGCPEMSRKSILELFHEKACAYSIPDISVSATSSTESINSRLSEELDDGHYSTLKRLPDLQVDTGSQPRVIAPPDISSQPPEDSKSSVRKVKRKDSGTQTDQDSVQCPIKSCQRCFIPVTDVVDHLETEHPDRVQRSVGQQGAHCRNYLLGANIRDRPNFTWRLILCGFEGRTFILNFRKVDFQYYAWVNSVGGDEGEAVSVTIRVHSPKSTLIYSRVCVFPIQMELEDILDHEDCFHMGERFVQQCKYELETGEGQTSFALSVQYLFQKSSATG